MQIFELHFNPKNKEGRLIDTFCYQPEDVYEKRLGALAIAGELMKGSSNKTLLNNLASKVKGTYHSLPTRTQEEALREGLKEGNEFLNNEDWEGSLNLAILSIKSDQLQFSKVGSLKILLARNGEITNIGQNAGANEENFGSIVTGKIKKKDKLIILTDDIYLNFANEDLLIDLAEDKSLNDEKLEKISKIQKDKFPKTSGICLLVDFSIETKQQEKIVSKDEFSFQKLIIKTGEELQKVGGFLLNKTKTGAVETVNLIKEKGKPTLIKGGQLFKAVFNDSKKAIKQILKTVNNKIKGVSQKTKNASKKKIKKIKEKKEQKKKGTSDKIEEVDISEELKNKSKKSTSKNSFKKNTKNKINDAKVFISKIRNFVVQEGKEGLDNFKKTIKKIKVSEYLPEIPKFEIPDGKTKRRSFYLMVLLLIIILVGSVTAHIERSRSLEDQQERLLQIEEEIDSINIDSEEAFDELLYHYQNLDNLIGQKAPYQTKARSLRSKTSQKLLEITNTEVIEDPEVLFKTAEIIPSKIELINGEIYTYNPFLSNTEKYDLETGEQLVRPVTFEDGGIFSLTSIADSLLFFSKPNEIVTSNEEQSSSLLTPPYENYSYQQLKSFQDHLYLLERESNQIIRYNQNNFNDPEIWIVERRPGNIRAFAIDGSIWMLKDNNEIWQYEENRPVQNSLINHEKIFPLPERFTKIETNSEAPIYILEPRNNRILISSKQGELIKQIILPEARNIKDLAIGQNKIYLLDSQEVYFLEVDF